MASRINRIPSIYISPIKQVQKTWQCPRIDHLRNNGIGPGETRTPSLESRNVQRVSDSVTTAKTAAVFSKGIYRAANRPTIPLNVTHYTIYQK
jgi:hypothetical protein